MQSSTPGDSNFVTVDVFLEFKVGMNAEVPVEPE